MERKVQTREEKDGKRVEVWERKRQRRGRGIEVTVLERNRKRERFVSTKRQEYQRVLMNKSRFMYKV